MDILWKIAARLYKTRGGGIRLIARTFEVISMSLCSHAISAQASIGKGTIFFHHGLGTVIHQDAVIGTNCKVFQNVTIGEKQSVKKNSHGVPIIGNNVLIGAGAVLLGNIIIGDNAVIGANAVILNNVDENDVVCGIPGKSIKKHT